MHDHIRMMLYGAGAVVAAKIFQSILQQYLNLNISM